MLGAIYIGLSGLQAYSEGLQKVSNNVSNLNSQGFKTSTITFSNLQGRTDTGGISLQNGSLGTGGGVGLARTTLDFKAGELRQTDKDLDIAINGTGLLVLQRGIEVRYARTGSFEVDKDGFIVMSGSDWRLATLDSAGRAVALSVDPSRTNPPLATTKIVFSDNLSSTATTYGVSDLPIYDASGTKHVWQVAFSRADTSSDWLVKVTDDKAKVIGEQTLKFSSSAPTAETSKLTYTDTDSGLSVLFDFSSGVTSFSGGTLSTLRAASTDGHAVGSVTTIAVNGKGELELTYSNNEKKQLGAVAVASFRDPTSLTQESAGLFKAADGADVALLASDDTRVGTVVSRRLEASNVDLSKEFGDLILIQRGYQASSQIVSTANDMIQQLFGIRGQG